MSAPVASGWSGRRVGLAPTGKAPPCHGARGNPTFALRELLCGLSARRLLVRIMDENLGICPLNRQTDLARRCHNLTDCNSLATHSLGTHNAATEALHEAVHTAVIRISAKSSNAPAGGRKCPFIQRVSTTGLGPSIIGHGLLVGFAEIHRNRRKYLAARQPWASRIGDLLLETPLSSVTYC
jgi:hypothetical protein